MVIFNILLSSVPSAPKGGPGAGRRTLVEFKTTLLIDNLQNARYELLGKKAEIMPHGKLMADSNARMLIPGDERLMMRLIGTRYLSVTGVVRVPSYMIDNSHSVLVGKVISIDAECETSNASHDTRKSRLI